MRHNVQQLLPHSEIQGRGDNTVKQNKEIDRSAHQYVHFTRGLKSAYVYGSIAEVGHLDNHA